VTETLRPNRRSVPFGREGRQRLHYEFVFAEAHGAGPHDCYFCTRVIEGTLVIHHLDHNPTNDEPWNLAPSHLGCHVSYHLHCAWSLGRRVRPENFVHDVPHTDEAKRKMSASQRAAGNAPSMEARSAGGKVPWTDERRANQSRAQSNRSPEWRERNAAANRGKKRSAESRERMREAALARHERERAFREAHDV